MKELSEWVEEAQSGNEEANCFLLEKYGYRKEGVPTGYLGKYYRLLVYGRIDLRDKDTRRFLQLYMPDKEDRNKLTRHYQDYRTTLQAQEVANYLQNKVSLFPKEDLLQELVLLFLECVNRYQKKTDTIDFSGYLYNSYRFKVYAFLRKRVFKYEWLHHPELCLLEDDIEDESATIEVQEAWFDRFYAADLKRNDLGIFWINGRCGSLFEPLSVFERMVLRDHDFYGLTDGTIAKRYGYHINTIYKRRHVALEKLKKEREKLFSP